MTTTNVDKITDMLVARQKAMDKAKIALMSRPDSAFFTTVCFSLKLQWDEKIPTAATNGSYLKFNTAFFMELTPDERVFLLLHESMHVAYLHMLRLSGRDHAKWNEAADHVINLMLIERGFKMPSGKNKCLADPQYKGLSTEEVYDLLPDQNRDANMQDLVEGDCNAEEVQREIEDILVRAAIQSKLQEDAPGTIPGDIELFLNKLLDPKLPWNRILQKYLQNMAKNDYSFRKPNRRYFPKYHLPGLYSESLMDLVIGVDISGSVSDEQFTVFITETHSLFKLMKPQKITLIQFDTSIQSVTELRSLRDLSQVKFTGRGGTDVYPLLEWVNRNKPQLLLVFTDGEFEQEGMETKTPNVWLIHNNPGLNIPIGKTIHYNI